MIFRLLACAVALLHALSTFAADIVIVNARIETVGKAGTLASGSVLIRDGRIAAVGESLPVPAGAQVIDAHSNVLTPGFIAPSTSLMATEVNLIGATRDDSSGNRLSAGFDIQYGLNPASTLIRVARQTGITMAAVTPLAGRFSIDAEGDDAEDGESLQGGGDGIADDPPLFAGQAAVVRMEDDSDDPIVRARSAVAVDLGDSGASRAGGSRTAALLFIRSALDDARDYARNRAAWKRGETRDYALPKIDLEALIPVAEGRTPLLVRVSRASEIRQILKLAREEHIRIILEDAEQGWMLADEIAAARVPVLIDPQDDLPNAFESLGSRLDNAAKLHAAGVMIAVKARRDFNTLRPIRLNAGTAVAYGLPYSAALESITINPARIWGVADRVGSIEAGKDADLVLWSGDPLETTSYPLAVFIRGVQQADTSRRLQLRDRYLAPKDGRPPAYH